MALSTNDWWTQRPMTEKLRIATKINDNKPVYSPQLATEIWLALPESKRKTIMKHATEKHGQVQKPYKKGHTFSF